MDAAASCAYRGNNQHTGGVAEYSVSRRANAVGLSYISDRSYQLFWLGRPIIIISNIVAYNM